MIEINLLPKELRKKKARFKIPDITMVFLPVAAGLIGFLILIQILLGFTIAVKNRTHERLDKEWNQILPQKREIDVIKQEIKKIQRRVGAVDRLMVERTFWSHKMKALSDSMIPGIWLTKLSLGEKALTSRSVSPGTGRTRGIGLKKTEIKTQSVRCLNIEGSASGSYGDETAAVGRFIKSLKQNEDFFSDFSRIELDEMQRKTIKDMEVMNFRISCYFK